MIEVCIVDIKPHPDQATNNPGCWAVKFGVTYDGCTRTFWRWHSMHALKDGRCVAPSNKELSQGEIIKRFWDDTFAELHGFSFDEEEP